MKDWKNILLMGLNHLLVAFTSIVVITRILGFNLPIAFLFAGIGTLVFHAVTKNKMPVILGVSGLYVGGILYATQTFGVEYAMGGIIGAGLVYIVLGLLMLKFQDQVLALVPEWLLNVAVLLIGLNLLPLGAGMMEGSVLVGVVSLAVVALVDLFGPKKIQVFAMPIGVLAGTLVALLQGSIDYSVLSQPLSLVFMAPKFSWGAILAIAPISFAVFFEMIGDSKNVSDAIGLNVYKEVGLGRIAIGNGLATILGGLFGANAYTTYSENTAYVMLSGYKDSKAQVVTSIGLILLGLFTPLSKLVMLIPQSALGGVVTYLFALIVVSSIKQLAKSREELENNKDTFITIIVMVALSYVTFSIGGVDISPVAVAIVVGVALNIVLDKVKQKRLI